MKPEDIIILKGKTLKGKNRIREHGDKWVIFMVGDELPLKFLHGKILIVPEKDWNNKEAFENGWKEMRWIHPTNDPDFEVIT
jgi:hypothetical protein